MTPQISSYCLIALTKGQFAIVDAEDFSWLKQWKWVAGWNKTSFSYYAYRQNKGFTTYMHREILNLTKGDKLICDHINHDTLDNRRENLRICTSSQNNAHSKKQTGSKSALKGASWHSQTDKWTAEIWHQGKKIYLGFFDTDLLAHLAYVKASKEIHGEFSQIE